MPRDQDQNQVLLPASDTRLVLSHLQPSGVDSSYRRVIYAPPPRTGAVDHVQVVRTPQGGRGSSGLQSRRHLMEPGAFIANVLQVSQANVQSSLLWPISSAVKEQDIRLIKTTRTSARHT